MSYWFYVSWQYIKKNITRSVYSIIGIMLTVMMCFSVFTLGYSYWDYGLLQVYGEEPYQIYGEIDANNESVKQLHRLSEDSGIKNIYIIFLGKKEADNTYSMSEEDYQIVGLNRDEGNGTRIHLNQIVNGYAYEIRLELKDTSDLRGSAQKLEQQYGIRFWPLKPVEEFLGQSDDPENAAYHVIVAIIGAIFAIFCILILRNTMMISIVERMKDYGLLRCVGMSKKQLYRLLVAEACIIGIVGIILGIASGYGCLKIIEMWINTSLGLTIPFTFHLYLRAVLWTSALCIAVVIYSVLEPARQALNLTPTDAIHNRIVLRKKNGARVEEYSHHSAGVFSKLFGAPGEYAYKNILRNRSKFTYLFVAMVICIMLISVIQSLTDSFYETIKGEYNVQEYETIMPELSQSDGIAEVDYEISEIVGIHKSIRITKLIALFIAVYITLISIIQICNTLHANILLRKRELKLYEYVGMSFRQRCTMLLIEHTAAVVLAIIVGYFLSWMLSRYLVKYMFGNMFQGLIEFIYVWPWQKVGLISIGLIGLILAVSMLSYLSYGEHKSK